MKTAGWVLVVIAALCALIALGRRPAPHLADPRTIAHQVPEDAQAIDAFLQAREAAAGSVIDGAHAHVHWHERPGVRAPVSILYLHGFSASPRELHPVMEDAADALGANVVFMRLHGHGLEGGDMADTSVDAWLTDAELGYQLARVVGDEVVIAATSTGAPLSLQLAARHRNDPVLRGQLLTSPNLGVRNPLAEVLLWPWGAPILRLAIPSRCGTHTTEEQRRYWTACYDTRGVIAMMDLIASVRRIEPETLDLPTRVFLNPDDPVIDPQAAIAWLERLPDVEITRWSPPGDADGHVLGGDLKSPEGTGLLTEAVRESVSDILHP